MIWVALGFDNFMNEILRIKKLQTNLWPTFFDQKFGLTNILLTKNIFFCQKVCSSKYLVYQKYSYIKKLFYINVLVIVFFNQTFKKNKFNVFETIEINLVSPFAHIVEFLCLSRSGNKDRGCSCSYQNHLQYRLLVKWQKWQNHVYLQIWSFFE